MHTYIYIYIYVYIYIYIHIIHIYIYIYIYIWLQASLGSLFNLSRRLLWGLAYDHVLSSGAQFGVPGLEFRGSVGHSSASISYQDFWFKFPGLLVPVESYSKY